MSEVRIERLVTRGVLHREGAGFEIDNNVWFVGNDSEVLVIDAAHKSDEIASAVGERNVLGILLTHGHEDHVNAAVETAKQLDTQTYLHGEDRFLWDEQHETPPDFTLSDGQQFEVAGLNLLTLHTPGHTPGSVSFVVEGHGVVFSGDTLFHGGPGATRWEYSDFQQIIKSIKTKLFTLAGDTTVLPGHGEATTVDAEVEQLEIYVQRGW